jgi:SulP family sulfate permease
MSLVSAFRFSPSLLGIRGRYSKAAFLLDCSAGLTVGIVALPLAMAFAIASGLRPEAGIFTAIIGGLIVSGLGGSRVQIGGPAGAFIVVVYTIVSRHGVPFLLAATMAGGVLLFAMGMARIGNLIRYIPVAIIIGFTNGIAVLIGLSQVGDFLGLDGKTIPAEFFSKLVALGSALPKTNPITLFMGLASLALVAYWPKPNAASGSGLTRTMARIPGTVVALALATVATSLLPLGIETIGTRFGGIPRALPSLALPSINLDLVGQLAAPAITIALLGSIESLLCARVADTLTGSRHDPNQELMAQGLANFIAPLFGGFCVTGTIARTVTNIRSGAVSPIAGIVHALVVLLIVLVAAPLAQNVPLATLAGILLYVAFNMGEWREFARLKRFSNNYRIILLSTFFLTVAVDLTMAIEVGLLLACLFFATRMSSLTKVECVGELSAKWSASAGVEVAVYRISGSLFFGAVDKIEAVLTGPALVSQFVILEVSGMINLDSSGLAALEAIHAALVKRSARLVLAGLQGQTESLVSRSGFASRLGGNNIAKTIEDVGVLLDGGRNPNPVPPQPTLEPS